MARLIQLVALVISVSMTFVAPTGVIAQQTGVAAAIHQGNCDDVGDVVAPLVEAVVGEGDLRGNAAAIPAASSFTMPTISSSVVCPATTTASSTESSPRVSESRARERELRIAAREAS